jgi:hypothetical protein
MKKQDKDKWIDDVMGSLDNVQRLGAPEKIFTSIERRIGSARIINMPASRVIPLKRASIAAAIIIMLGSFNFYMMQRETLTTSNRNNMDKLAKYYQFTDNNPLYNL